jgi:hypothetical protein
MAGRVPGRPFVSDDPRRSNGRQPGTPNRVSVELRTLFGQLVNDPDYQRKFREDFKARRVHPLTEARVWEYHTGKPKTEIDINARVELTARFQLEAELLRGLDLDELEALAAESQALIDRAVERSKRPLDVVVEASTESEPAKTLEISHDAVNGISIIGPK